MWAYKENYWSLGKNFPIFVTSSEKRQGREELLAYIDQINATIQKNHP